MPGITGIIRREPYPGIERDLELMAGAMRHEKFYVSRDYVNRDLGLYIGWAAHPNTLGAYMPIVSQDKRVVLIITGEHFGSHDESFYRKRENICAQTREDFLSLYRESEDRFVRSLNGWFSGVAVDLEKGKVAIFNDRYGMGRIYWHQGDEEFIFGSEAKSLLRVRNHLRAIKVDSLAEFLNFNCVLGDKTLFKGISLLPGASFWSFSKTTIPQKKKYFDFSEWEHQPILPAGEFYTNFKEIVSSVFPRYAAGTDRVGMSLSAGLDTRLILSSALGSCRELPCYTFGGMWGETYDIRTARRLAQICRQPHEVIRINEEFLRDFGSYAQKCIYISDGAHDALGAHDVYFNQLAHKIAPIRLTGKFGSEVVRTRKLIAAWNFPRRLVQPDLAQYLAEAQPFTQISEAAHPLTRVVSQEIAWGEYGRVSVEQAEVILRTPYMDNALVKLMYQAQPNVRSSRELQARYVIENGRSVAGVPTNLGPVLIGHRLLGHATYLPLWALFKIEYIYLYSTPHWLTWVDRKLAKLRLERIIPGRQKFEAYRIWMKTHLADYLREVLLSPSARHREFFDKKAVVKAVNGHLAGTHNYIFEINKMLTVELILSSLLTDSAWADGPTAGSLQGEGCAEHERQSESANSAPLVPGD
jgi:asparagine synthase (glutamine-hydrolysing)